jgi:catechol 2,3-dioxygenase-like lactoylglutathione lyase family enzyme
MRGIFNSERIMATELRADQEASGILADARVVYLIIYVNDLAESRTFYETRLGLRVVEADEASVKLDAGQVMVVLQRAADYGIELVGRHDDSSDVVFLVDDVNAVRADLESRGVTFVRRRTYEIGLVTDFYDPNGHRLMIYQPSTTALGWPSADKLREVWRAAGVGGSHLIGPPSHLADADEPPRGLDGKPLVYMFMFVPSSDEALAFYQGDLGLNAIERVHCCNPACPPEEKGIVKYDAGGMLLTTHHVHRSPVVDDFGKIYSPRSVDRAHTRGIAPVFLVRHIKDVVERLQERGVPIGQGAVKSQIGDVARIESATGHAFFLYEPWAPALQWPSGVKLGKILEAAV